MPILKDINDLKPKIYDLEQEAKRTMPDEIRDNVLKSISEIRDAINNTGSLIEKHYQDEKLLNSMKQNLNTEMEKEAIYDDLPKDKKDEIIENIIEDPEINLIKEEEFKEFILDQLKIGTPENLIKTAYSKNSIIELGDAIAPKNSSQNDKYQYGLDILFDMVKTPTGRDDALGQGVKRALSDPTIRKHYLFLYYGIIPSAKKEEAPPGEANE